MAVPGARSGRRSGTPAMEKRRMQSACTSSLRKGMVWALDSASTLGSRNARPHLHRSASMHVRNPPSHDPMAPDLLLESESGRPESTVWSVPGATAACAGVRISRDASLCSHTQARACSTSERKGAVSVPSDSYMIIVPARDPRHGRQRTCSGQIEVRLAQAWQMKRVINEHRSMCLQLHTSNCNGMHPSLPQEICRLAR